MIHADAEVLKNVEECSKTKLLHFNTTKGEDVTIVTVTPSPVINKTVKPTSLESQVINTEKAIYNM